MGTESHAQHEDVESMGDMAILVSRHQFSEAKVSTRPRPLSESKTINGIRKVVGVVYMSYP